MALLSFNGGPAGAVLALGCVVAGGPWFADGLRALRARRVLRRLAATPAREPHEGPTYVRGTVVLDSPMFAPLSGRPCARWQLDVRDARGLFAGHVSEQRDFRLQLAGDEISVTGDAEWHVSIGVERTYTSAAQLSENVAAQLDRVPELRWIKTHGGAFTLVERALFAGAEAHVIGRGVRGEAAWAEAPELLRTGTDDFAWETIEAETASAPEWRIVSCPEIERCIVGDRALAPGALAPPAWRTAGALLGPALSLAGLVVLAEVAGRSLDRGL